MKARERLVKIVRVGVPRFLGSSEVEYRPAEISEQERHELLIKKLGEEVLEYAMNPTLGELADIYDAIDALAWAGHSLPLSAIAAEARRKRIERGSFLTNHGEVMGMYVTTTAPSRHEGEHAVT